MWNLQFKKKKKNSTSLSTTYNVSKCIQINEISPNKSCLLVILPVSSYSWNAMQVYYTLLNYNEQFEWHSASQWKIRNVLLWKINHLYKVCSLCDFNESLGTIVSKKTKFHVQVSLQFNNWHFETLTKSNKCFIRVILNSLFIIKLFETTGQNISIVIMRIWFSSDSNVPDLGTLTPNSTLLGASVSQF